MRYQVSGNNPMGVVAHPLCEADTALRHVAGRRDRKFPTITIKDETGRVVSECELQDEVARHNAHRT